MGQPIRFFGPTDIRYLKTLVLLPGAWTVPERPRQATIMGRFQSGHTTRRVKNVQPAYNPGDIEMLRRALVYRSSF